MKIEFPIRHIQNNLVFNKNGDVWCYFEVDTFNFELLKFEDTDIHIFTDNNRKIYVGYKLKQTYSESKEKNAIKENIVSFFEGFASQVNRSVGLNEYSILKNDISDYMKQSNNIKEVLKKIMSVKELKVEDILINYISSLTIYSNMNIEGVIIEDYVSKIDSTIIDMENENTIMYIDEEDEKVLYQRQFVVRSLVSPEDVYSLLNLSIPVVISVRIYNGLYSIIIKTHANEYKDLLDKINVLYNSAKDINITLFSPLTDQFNVLYETILGSNKVGVDYTIKHILSNSKEVNI